MLVVHHVASWAVVHGERLTLTRVIENPFANGFNEAVLCYSMDPNEHAPQRASAFMFIFTNNVIFAKNNYYTER